MWRDESPLLLVNAIILESSLVLAASGKLRDLFGVAIKPANSGALNLCYLPSGDQ